MGRYSIAREQLKQLKKPLLHLCIIIFILYILSPKNPIQFTIIIVLYSTLNNLKVKPLGTLKSFVSTYILIWLLFRSALYGLLGFVLIILGISLYRIIKNWQGYVDAIHTIETMLYGKPLKIRRFKWIRRKNS